ncbi:hypothetical protein Pyn_40610 [Prunus yedoensis var. nudiflora]|uniref:Uncharacterized protein n=1 Tax=Prunus yedoensis var. nudiflora TaxID=2094558 RepID=A0A314YHB3_PRUYE|nr:hypothetical protein Pyn_40610 [Prunus yedoensis var. nudiflora]
MVFHTYGVFANLWSNGQTDAIRKRSSDDWLATYNITLYQANSGMKAWGISKWRMLPSLSSDCSEMFGIH